MRPIRKGEPPTELEQYKRNTANASFQEFSAKESLRASLVREQSGLCCYCMCRIENSPRSVRVEHWHPQSGERGKQLELEYQNLLAACSGQIANRQRKVLHSHCDHAKGNQLLAVNSANADHHGRLLSVSYKRDGTIHCRDPELEVQLNAVLNLSNDVLKDRRKAARDQVIDLLRRRFGTRRISQQVWNDLRGRYTDDSNEAELPAYADVVLKWIESHIR